MNHRRERMYNNDNENVEEYMLWWSRVVLFYGLVVLSSYLGVFLYLSHIKLPYGAWSCRHIMWRNDEEQLSIPWM